MVNYQKTKIYYIPVGNDRYYGHTTQSLCTRKAHHKTDFKTHPNMKIYKTMREVGLSENDIDLIWVEDYPCENKEQAHARERYYVEQFGSLNMRLPTITQEERDEYHKHYNEAHKDIRREYSKQHYQTNKEKRSVQIKQYYEANKDKIAVYFKEWETNNREKRNARKRERYALKKAEKAQNLS